MTDLRSVTAEVRAHLEREFRFPSQTAWKPIGDGETMNTSWLGNVPVNRQVILRRYNAKRDTGLILAEHQILPRLTALFGDRIADPLRNEAGSSLFSVGNRTYALFPFLPGERADPGNQRTCMNMGKWLAGIHEMLWHYREKFTTVETLHPGIASAERPPLSLLSKQLKAISGLREEFTDDNILAGISDRHEKALLRREKLLSCRHLIHGDYGFPNLLVLDNGERLSGILDWEECRWDSPLFDLASCYPIMAAADHAMADCFLNGYLDQLSVGNHPLAKNLDEIRTAMPDLISISLFHELNLMLDNDFRDARYLQEILTALTV